MKQISLGIAILVGAVGAASAAPPASCRDKFVGTWKYFGGSTVIRPDGTAIPSIGVKYQTWTCNGNQYIFSNPDGQTWTSTLSADGNKLVGPGTATRVGAARLPTAKQKAASIEPKPEENKEPGLIDHSLQFRMLLKGNLYGATMKEVRSIIQQELPPIIDRELTYYDELLDTRNEMKRTKASIESLERTLKQQMEDGRQRDAMRTFDRLKKRVAHYEKLETKYNKISRK